MGCVRMLTDDPFGLKDAELTDQCSKRFVHPLPTANHNHNLAAKRYVNKEADRVIPISVYY